LLTDRILSDPGILNHVGTIFFSHVLDIFVEMDNINDSIFQNNY